MEEKSMEMFAFKLIANAGDARSHAFQALQAAKENDFSKSQELLKQSREFAKMAHQVQTDLLVEEAQGAEFELGILSVHAQDHLMTSLLAEELITEMIEIRQELNNLKKYMEEK